MAPVGTVIPARRSTTPTWMASKLVVLADRHSIILQRFHGGAIGAHLGTALTLALAEQGFYWPGKSWREQDLHRMRLRDAEETTGTTGAATSIHRRGPDGMLGDGCSWALPHHLEGEPILPHGEVLFFELA